MQQCQPAVLHLQLFIFWLLRRPSLPHMPQVYEVFQYHKSPRYQDLLPLLGSQSMVLTEDHVWKAQRQAFNPGLRSIFGFII
jgi:cytochrome P450